MKDKTALDALQGRFVGSAKPAFANLADPKRAWACMFSSSHAKIVNPLPNPA